MTRQLFRRPILFAVLLALSAAPAVRGQATDAGERRAFLTIRVHEDAKLTVDGVETRSKGTVRRFYSPPLEPGKTYHYTFVAEWMPGNNYETYTVKRKVEVTAGARKEIDMSKMDRKQGDQLFIRFVPTPPEVVDAMMKLGHVGKDDVVYDLGCGDGIIVVTAVDKFKAKRGVGVDLDPERLKEARQRAKRAGVEDRVEFRKDDVLNVDVSDATVVMLYLSDDLNLKLRPNLQKQLKPGTRIVTHRFLMGDWKPDKTETIDGEDGDKYDIHLWTIKKK